MQAEVNFDEATEVRNPALEAITADSQKLSDMLERHRVNVFEPTEQKVLRDFTSAEAAGFLKITPGNLRRMHHEGRIPEVKTDNSKRRLYSLADIQAIREAIAENNKNYLLPNRRGDEHCQVFTVSTFKGGSGKTTSVLNLAQVMAMRGYRVLCVDLDPQASLTAQFGLGTHRRLEKSIYDVIKYDDPSVMSDVVMKTYFHNLDLAPGSITLTEFETTTPSALRIPGELPFYYRLKSAIAEVSDNYDMVFIDCPPQLGFLTLSAVFSATGLFVPIVPSMIDVESLSQYLEMMEAVIMEMKGHGVELDAQFIRYFMCRYDTTDSTTAQMAGFLRMIFGNRLFTNTFVKSAAVPDAGVHQKTIYEVARSEITRSTLDRALENFNAVADEVEQVIQLAWGREL